MNEKMLLGKKLLKRDANRIGVGLLLYTGIIYGILLLQMMVEIVRILLMSANEAEMNILFERWLEKSMESAFSSIIATVLGTAFLLFFFRKKVGLRQLFTVKRKMTLGIFVQLVCVFMGGQVLFQMGGTVMESGLNLIGYSVREGIESASEVSNTVSMFLYAGLFGPIVEEVIYRGLVLRCLEKQGKMLAIFISSLLFGVMHGNLAQIFFAFGVGLILAYVTVEYSIVWSIALHIINNCVLGDLLSYALSGFSDNTQEIIYGAISGILFMAGMVIAWKKRNSVKAYIAANPIEGKKCLSVLTAVAVMIFMVLEVGVAISGLTPLT